MTAEKTRFPLFFLTTSIAALLLAGCQPAAEMNAEPADSQIFSDQTQPLDSAITVSNDIGGRVVIDPANWPEGQSGVERDAQVEAFVADILSRMTVEEKVGQVIQADISEVTPELAAQYHLGSVLNGGNSGPGDDNFAPPEAWLALADAYYNASTDTSDGGAGIPIIWGTDAVHGHSNIVGATLFPHNIGLGAANNPDLIRRIGRVTALEVRATGQEWTFAPTLAVVQNDTWGRTYEGYSEHPEIVARLSGPMVEGLQGTAGSEDFLGAGYVVATAKHWVGDGGTDRGIDQGDNRASEADMRDIHAAGYPPAITAGVQTVMASFNSWHGIKMHGNGAMLTDVLVDRLGFDGFVIGDWEGHGQIAGCENENCPQALIAGVDMYMAPASWQGLYYNLLEQVGDGTIPMERLDEAVTRILRVKVRAGLFDGLAPSERPYAGDFDLIGSEAHRSIAREAVRESLVLLKNNDGILPLDPSSRILLAGYGADNLQMQSGGWTINWQGEDLTNENFPGGQSILDGLQEAFAPFGGTVTLSEDGSYSERPDVAVVVFGEEPYAEFVGDQEYVDYPDERGLALLRQFQENGIPTVAIFMSGRPLWVNRELNASDAFVAAWLPGSEGGGIADVLVANPDGSVRNDFAGRLSYSWPRYATQTVLNEWDDDYDPLFAYGYGLTYADPGAPVGPLGEDSGIVVADGSRQQTLLQNGRAANGYSLMIADSEGSVTVSGPRAATESGRLTAAFNQRSVQDDSRLFIWTGPAELRVSGMPTALDGNEVISITYEVAERGTGSTMIGAGCGENCEGRFDITAGIRLAEGKGWRTARLPLRCFAETGADLSAIDTPLIVTGSEGLEIAIADISIIGDSTDELGCEL